MKNSLFTLVAIATVSLGLMAFMPKNQAKKSPKTTTTELKWLTWEQAVEMNKTAPKKIFIDVFTEWCGWCKVMDQKTFTQEAVAKYMSDHFYCVKFDAEQTGDVVFNGQTFKYVIEPGQRRGVHTFAYALLDGKMGYPSVVYLNEKYERIMVSPGFKEAPDMLKELTFAKEEAYKTKSWEDYKANK